MTTIAPEHREYTMFHMVNHMVWEARRNDDITRKYGDKEDSDVFPSTEKLLMSLTRQAPNRIYFGPDGKVCRVLFFREQGFHFRQE